MSKIKGLSSKKRKIGAAISCLALMATLGTTTAFAARPNNTTDLIDDAEGTRYSVDGGQTWTQGNPVDENTNGYDEIDVTGYASAIVDGDPNSDDDYSNAIFGGHFDFDDGNLDISFEQK
jgi:hypothetical protein